MSVVTYYAPDEDGEMKPEGTWQNTEYCWVRREDYAKLRELIGLHREQKLEKDVTSADRRLWDLALEVKT